MIVLVAGLPGTGKSTLARELALLTHGRVLSKDEIRHAVFAPDEIEYSSVQDDLCLEIMLRAAGFLLERDRRRVIFLDGRPFSRRYQIENAISFAESIHQPWRILECVCSEETALSRLKKDSAAGIHQAGNRDASLYAAVKARFEAICHPRTVIDTDQPLEECIAQARAALRA
ncbi:MAG TPA: AAA family ATPase [Candidatus Sulfotelmatobacter sp.]|nr:AAA family ATPase [Candidatus Sulfotelmatobacter sp.]